MRDRSHIHMVMNSMLNETRKDWGTKFFCCTFQIFPLYFLISYAFYELLKMILSHQPCVCMHRLTWWMKMQDIDLSMIGNQCTEGWNKMICTNLSVPAEGFATIFLSSWEHDRDFLTKSGRKRLTVSKAGDIKEVQRLKLGCFFDIHKR